MSYQAALDSDRRIIIIVQQGCTLRADGRILNKLGADCFQAPEHRAVDKLAPISAAENAKHAAARAPHFASLDARGQVRAAMQQEALAAKGDALNEADEAVIDAALPAIVPDPVRYLSHAGTVVKTKPAQAPPRGGP